MDREVSFRRLRVQRCLKLGHGSEFPEVVSPKVAHFWTRKRIRKNERGYKPLDQGGEAFIRFT